MLDFASVFYKNIFRTLDNNAVLMRVEQDGSYYPVWCSKEFTEMMEGTTEDFIRLESGGTMNTIHPDDRDEVAYLFRHHVTRAGTRSLDVRKITVKGNWIWVNIHYAFLEYDGVQYAYCSYFNVTQLKENEQRAKVLYENICEELESVSENNLESLRLNLTKGIVEASDRQEGAEATKGVSIAEKMEEHLRMMLFEEDRQRFRESFDIFPLLGSYHLGKSVLTDVFFTRRPNGRQCFVKYVVTMRRDPDSGDIMAFVTERDCNAELVNDTLLHKALVEQYDMITYLVDGQYGVVIGDESRIGKGSIFPRENFGEYGDYLREQVIPVIEGTEEERRHLAEALQLSSIERELAEKEPYEVNISCRIQGEVFYKRFVFYLVDQRARFYILLKSDTTELQKRQILRNENLRVALEEAKQANIAKTAFLSSMSHEIRTPMNAIIGIGSIALKEPDLPLRTREHLEKIGASARHLLSLINDILDMSRIESGRMLMKSEEFSFGSMLEQINTMCDSQCQDKGLQYDCIILGKVDEYYIGDSMKLKQVLINILGNAVKFTAPGGKVSMTVERIALYEDKTTLRFIIGDTGIGMDADFLPKIFDAFSQEDGTTTTSYGGTGLGMAITRNIVELMNGHISVKSEKGAGSEFTVDITLKNSSRTGCQACGISLQDMNVLVIDDDPMACEHAKLILEEIGISADTCLDGDTALEKIRLHHARHEDYNLILVDFKMPKKNGIEVTRDIRSVMGDDLAIIILTVYNWDAIMEEGIQAGVDSFMSKPLFASALISEFQQVARRKNPAMPGKKPKADLAGRRILLAEDMVVNAEIMKELLHMRGMEVEHAENGKRAVELFENSPENHYDAVLMDIRMPVKDGLAATEAIRALPRKDAKRVPIIAMTANAFDEDVQRSLQAGMNAHLSKPVEPEHLYETLEEMIP